jgi:hypothetical protein
MSRFADPTKVETVPLGPCQCPGTPHEHDEAVVRWDLGTSALARIGAAELTISSGDVYAGYRQLIVEATVRWNLQTEYDGKVVDVPVAPATVAELDEDTLTTLARAIDDLVSNKGPLPNGCGAPSPASPQGSASPTQPSTPTPGT